MAGAVLALVLVSALAVFWMTVGGLLSLLGGWSRLARRHRAAPGGPRASRSLESGYVGWVRYRNLLSIGVGPQGLFLAVLPMLRFLHPPLRIPWTSVKRLGSLPMWRLTFEGVEVDGVRILLPPWTARELDGYAPPPAI